MNINKISFVNGAKLIPAMVVAGTMAMNSVVANVPQEKKENKNNIEMFSASTSQAIKAMTLPQVQQIPTTQSQKIHDNFMKFVQNKDEFKAMSDYENNAYNQYGSYMGVALTQLQVNRKALMTFINGNTELIKIIVPEVGKQLENSPELYYGNVLKNKKALSQKVNYVINMVSNSLTSAGQNKKLSKNETVEAIDNAFMQFGLNQECIDAAKSICNYKKPQTIEDEMIMIANYVYLLCSIATEPDIEEYISEDNKDVFRALTMSVSPEK